MGFRSARLLALAVGLFTVGAQAALLREYLVSFRGSELALGLLFFWWFAWIAIGAWMSRRLPGVARFARRHVTALAALQPVGTLVGMVGLSALRLVAGVPSWAPTPLGWLALGAIWATLPAGLVTGLVFPAVCEASSDSARTGARIAYVWESIGAVLGGVLATAAFALGADSMAVVAGLGTVLVVAAGNHRRGRGRGLPWALALALIVCLASLVPPSGTWIREGVRDLALSSNLAGATRVNQVETPYHQVTTARLGEQFIVLVDGEVSATFPSGPEVAGEAALLAAQPGSRGRALLLGNGRPELAVALCRLFDSVEMVALDGQATRALWAAREAAGGAEPLPPNLRVRVADPRAFATTESAGGWDLVVIASPEPETRVAGRMYSREFLAALAPRMAADGVVAAFVRSGENALVGELLRYGQSIWQTFASEFPEVAVAPGEIAVLLASRSPGVLSTDPDELARRYAALAGPQPPFDPRRFPELIRADRARFVRDAYAAEADRGLLVHSDGRPLSSFLAMLASLQRSGSPGTGLLWSLFDAGPAVIVLALLCIAFWVFRGRLRSPGDAESLDSGARVLIGASGGASIAASIVLLAQYQSVVGAVHRDIGAATALTMAGLAAGGRLGAIGGQAGSVGRAIGVSAAGMVLLAAMPWLLPDAAGAAAMPWVLLRFGVLFVAVGVVTGAAWPIAAGLARLDGVAATLQSWDHLGAALLAGLTGVVLLPLFGTAATLAALAGGMGIAASAVMLDRVLVTPSGRRFLAGRAGRAWAFAAWPRGFALAGALGTLAVLAVAVPRLAGRPDPALSPELSAEAVRRVDPAQVVVRETRPFPHMRLQGVSDPPGDAVMVATTAVVPGLRGWGGAFNLAVSVGEDGRIRRARVLSHRETPAYVRDLGEFLARFEGRDLAELLAAPGGGIDAMTGATVTSRAMGDAVVLAGRGVATDVLGLELPGAAAGPPWWTDLLDARLAYVLLALVGGLWIHRRAGARTRLLFLGGVVVGGYGLDVQLSAPWLQSLARGEFPAWSASPALWLLTFGVLAIGVFQGPVYCAHGCPFGAAQELVGRLGQRFGLARVAPAQARIRARAIKYVVLACVLMTPLLAGPARAVAWDPLAAWMAQAPARLGLVLAGVAGVASLVWFRPWCRFLCPVGAFLNLFNRPAGWLGRVPPRAYGSCDLGVLAPEDIDCLQCNRCVRQTGDVAAPPRSSARVFWVVMGVLVAGVVLGLAQGLSRGAADPGISPGVRRVDVEQVLRQMDEGRLSNHEAQYWVPLP